MCCCCANFALTEGKYFLELGNMGGFHIISPLKDLFLFVVEFHTRANGRTGAKGSSRLYLGLFRSSSEGEEGGGMDV